MTDSQSHHDSFDPGRQQLAAIYAKALIGAAEKTGSGDQIIEELDSFVDDVLERIPQLATALESPRVAPADKEILLDRALAGKMHGDLLNFFKVVCRHGRMDCLHAIQAEVHDQWNDIRGRVSVEVTTATETDQDVLQMIGDSVGRSLGREVVLASKVNPDLIGGMVVRVGDTVYDGSVANRLQRVKKQTLAQAGHAIREAVDRFVPPASEGEA